MAAVRDSIPNFEYQIVLQHLALRAATDARDEKISKLLRYIGSSNNVMLPIAVERGHQWVSAAQKDLPLDGSSLLAREIRKDIIACDQDLSDFTVLDLEHAIKLMCERLQKGSDAKEQTQCYKCDPPENLVHSTFRGIPHPRSRMRPLGL